MTGRSARLCYRLAIATNARSAEPVRKASQVFLVPFPMRRVGE